MREINETSGRLAEAAAHRQRLSRLDARLRHLLIPGGFIWEPALAEAFPREEFWFLYGQPRKK